MTSTKQEDIVKHVTKIQKKAYAPYSDFQVGAGVQVESGEWYLGCNVENASYGATLCAERVAIVKAVSDGWKRILKLVLVTATDPASYPCGMCLQVMSEFMAGDADIVIANLSGVQRVTTLDELFPHRFDLPQHD